MRAVRATQPGFYGCFREAGEVFEIADPCKEQRKNDKGEAVEITVDPLSKNWMEPVEAEKPVKAEKAEKAAK